MRFTPDVARGDWILPRLHGWGVVGSTVPRGFEAYARVLHPVTAHVPAIRTDVEPEDLRWSEVAVRSTHRPRAVVHPLVQWAAVSGEPHGTVPLADGRQAGPPRIGSLDVRTLGRLARHLAVHTSEPDLVTAGVWSGDGSLRPGTTSQAFVSVYDDGIADHERHDPAAVPPRRASLQAEAEAALFASVDPETTSAADDGPLLELPGRDYVLLDGTTGELVDGSWTRTSGLGWFRGLPGAGPNLLWPADLAWCVASEIDFDSTLVGGSRALVEAICGDETLEAFEVTEDDDLSLAGDTLNPVPGGG
ncbi:hypothetical protein [Luteimicrobium sp. DT211]|uniref:hypothetical protein n=1 Tax=Luteimicrobium sp. DT211 TaxID=3393412 RepID=UPI003CEA77D4